MVTNCRAGALFRAINLEYARSVDGCVLRTEGRRSSIEGLKRWCLTTKPGQGPGLSTIIDSVDIAWMEGEWGESCVMIGERKGTPFHQRLSPPPYTPPTPTATATTRAPGRHDPVGGHHAGGVRLRGYYQ